jgi:uncharacterized membrane protein
MKRDDREHRTGRRAGVAAAAFAAATAFVCATSFVSTTMGAQAASPLTDAEAVALAARHCTLCHAEMPTHEAFDKPPKGIRLETIEQLRRYAKQIVEQAVVGRMMPLGNETDMTDEERDRLGAWAEGLK